MEDQEESKKFGYHQLRLMAVEHLVMYRELLFDEISEDIRMTYGALEDVEEEGSSYSYKSYCEYMMKNGTWCEPVMLKAIASMWSAKITVIHADNFFHTTIRHKGDPFNADIVIVFNASYFHGHYISCLRTNGENFIIGSPERDAEYDRGLDRVERVRRQDFDWMEEGEGEMMVVPMEVYKMLIYKAEQYDKVVELAKEPTPDLEGEPEPRLPSLQPHSGSQSRKSGPGGDGRKRKGDNDDDDDNDDDNDDDDDNTGVVRDPADPTTRKKKGGKYQAEEKIPDEELGDDVTVCPRCKREEKTHTRLMTHVKKFHEDIFNFLCKECDRGFITRSGWKTHMKSHSKKAKRLPCEKGCDKDFVDMKSLKGHYRKIHPPGGLKDIPCPFTDCPKIFQNTTNLAQHKRCCPKNPHRKQFICPMCGKGGFWNLNKFQEHKRDNHRWR